MLTIDEFTVENIFNKVETKYGPVYYASTKDRDGWIVVWPDGESFHSYRDPIDFLETV